jgi:hypothetical protein
MYLLEFQAQGVRAMSPAVRVAFKPGYLVIKPPGAALPPFAGLAAALLYSDGRGGDAAYAEAGQKGKAAFTILGNDQNTYRLVRELGGAGVLQRLNKQTTTYEPVSDSAADITTFLKATVGMPQKTTFEQLFIASASQMPSRRPRSSAAAGGSGSKPALGSSAPKPSLTHNLPVEPAADIPAAQAKVRELEKELALAQEVEKLQFDLDGLTRQMDELEAKMKGSEGLRGQLAEAEESLAAAPTAQSLDLPPDIVSRAERYPAAVKKRDEALAKLNAESPADEAAGLEPLQTPSAIPPLTQDRNFLAGVGAGVLFLALGFLLDGNGRLLALLDIPAFGFAALIALRYVEQLQNVGQTSRKGGFRAQREKKILDTFEAETQLVKEAMKKLSVDSPEQVVQILGQRPLFQEKVNELRAQLEAWEADPANRAMADQHQKMKARQEAMNQALTEKGAYIREAREVERELARTRESIAKAQSGGGAPASPAPAPAAAAAPAAAQGPELEDPGPALMRHASDLLQLDIPSTANLVRDRAAQYLSALTDRRYTGLEQDLTGAITVVTGGQKVKAGAVPPRDLDIVYLALRLTLIEKCSAKSKVPFLVEDTLGLEEGKLSLLSRMLKHLGTVTQVIHVTPHAAFQGVADGTGNL